MNNVLYDDGRWKIQEEEVTLPDGRNCMHSRVYAADDVYILPLKDSQTLLLLREYRPCHAEWLWNLPHGLVDKEQDVATAAQRELQEETGYRARDLQHWFSTSFSEHFVRTTHIFVASDLDEDPLEKDEHELIEVHEVALEQAIKDVSENRYSKNTMTAYALLRYGAEHDICPKG